MDSSQNQSHGPNQVNSDNLNSNGTVAPPARKPESKRRPPYLLVGLIAVVLAIGILPRLGQAKQLSEQAAEAKSAEPSVNVKKLSMSTEQGELALPSNLQAIDQTSINARTAGYVAKRLVDIGSVVKKGDLLAVIESPDLDAQFGQSQAQAAQSRALYEASQADSAKLQAGIVGAIADVSRSESARAEALSNLAHARAKLTQSESAIKVAKARVLESERRLSEAKAGRTRAKATFAFASKTLTRWKELERANAVSGQDVDEKQAEYDTSQAQVEASEAAVSTAEAELTAAQESVTGAEAEAKAAQADVQSSQGRVDSATAAIASVKANAAAAHAAFRAGKASVSSASSAVASSDANADRLRYLQSYERIVAPFDGVITARNVDVGDLVNPNSGGGATDQANAVTHSGLFGLAKPDVIRALVSVPEQDAVGIKEGQLATITVQELPGRKFVGRVFLVSGALDTSTRTLSVEVRVQNADRVLRPGMYAQVIFHGKSDQSHLWMPADALIFDAKGTRVAVVKDDVLHYVPVKLGRDLGDRIEVLGGLSGEEEIVLNPDSSMADGIKVHAVEAAR